MAVIGEDPDGGGKALKLPGITYILVPGQVVSREILAFMRALDVSEIHGYRADLGLRVFTEEALAKQTRKLATAAE